VTARRMFKGSWGYVKGHGFIGGATQAGITSAFLLSQYLLF